ncbi:MAG TPA: hypothetical protein PKE45_01005 [Caldilineaceae bacterium]|nr:hypothetical protein [Caldilineaceae bacterium]
MNFFKSLTNLFRGGSSTNNRMLTVYVLSRRCNEPIAGQVDLLNELSQTDEGSEHTYYARKVFSTSGQKRCFDQVEVELYFDQNKKVAEYQITGGRWLEPADYEQELARFNAPPEESEEKEA